MKMQNDDKALLKYLKAKRVLQIGEKSVTSSIWGNSDKQHVIEIIKDIVEKWAETECKAMNVEGSGKFIIFGSYMAGGHVGFDYDIDAICLVPKCIKAKPHFFENLVAKLQN